MRSFVSIASIFVLATVALAVTPGDGPTPDREALNILTKEVNRLLDEVRDLREANARLKLDNKAAERELAELRQFIEDNERLGNDFDNYRGIKAIAEREARARQHEENRIRREAIRAEQRARQEAARAQRDADNAEEQRVESYRKRGFMPVGLDVFVGKMAFHYPEQDGTPYRLDYEPILGRHVIDVDYPRRNKVDWNTMTISGSVLNATSETRHIGIAITFFDESGNQVGHETVQIENARSDVPYPFTSEIAMALDRPFSSSSTYVLYADLAETE